MKRFLGQKIFVTGGNGFIGSHLVRRLVHEGAKPHLLLRPSSDTKKITDLLNSCTIHEGDLIDHSHLRAIIKKVAPDGVFHLAASLLQSGVTASVEELIDTNIGATVALLDEWSLYKSTFFLNTGSFTEVGMKKHAITERDCCEPSEFYGISKLAGTLYGQSLGKMKGKPVVTLRIFTPYGPGIQKGRLVREVAEKFLNGESVSLTYPKVSRDFIYVEDLVDLYLDAAFSAKEHAGEIFNAGTGVQTTLEELVNITAEAVGKSGKVEWGSFRNVAYDDAPWCADTTKTFRAFSWRPAHTLQEGIEKTVIALRREIR